MKETSEEDTDTVTPFSSTEVLREFAPHPYHSLNSDGEILTVNDAWLDILGYDREEVEGHWFGEFLAKGSVDVFETRFPEFKSAGSVSNVEFEMQCAGGEIIVVSFDGRIEYDDDGSFVRTHCQFMDITKRKQYETFIKNSSDVILLHDETGEAKYVSPAAEREFGYDPDALMGKDPFQDVHPDDRKRVKKTFSRLLSEPDKVVTEEYRIQDADGSYVWVESKGRNLLGEKVADGILINSRVIDERKKYQQDLERQNESLDGFASVLSHDLRNPLNVAQGRIELAREEYDSEHVDIAARAVDRSLDLIEDMLELARAGHTVSEIEPVEVADLADVCWDTVETDDAEIRVDLNSTIQADRSRLRQMLENLFSNSIEHGGEDVTVRIGSLPEGFYVEDDGPGIPHDEREKVWESGYSGADDGTGFGLAIVKQIVEAHAWDIRITDGSDGGARFEITGVEVVAE